MYGLDLVIVIDGIPVGVTRFGRKETLLVDFITKESQHQTETGKENIFLASKISYGILKHGAYKWKVLFDPFKGL